MKKYLEKIFDFLTNNIVTFIAAIFGGLAPGILTIVAFNVDFFIQIDVFKIILLACSISIPSLAIIFVQLICVFEKGKTIFEMGDKYITLALNAMIFDVALFLKVIDSSMNLKGYVTMIVVFCFLICIILTLLGKEKKSW